MAAVKSRDTKPELVVRKFLHGMGYRFRLYCKDLPGKPDIVLPKYNVAIFVHGCYWHRHPGCKKASTPTTNPEFWKKKFSESTARDQKQQAELRQMGWKVIVIWECEVKKIIESGMLPGDLQIILRNVPKKSKV